MMSMELGDQSVVEVGMVVKLGFLLDRSNLSKAEVKSLGG